MLSLSTSCCYPLVLSRSGCCRVLQSTGVGLLTSLNNILQDAHDAPLSALHFFPGQPLLMSAAQDNSIKQWLFDAPDNSARLLRFRSGHSEPPTLVRHYGEGHRLLSAGELAACACELAVTRTTAVHGTLPQLV